MILGLQVASFPRGLGIASQAMALVLAFHATADVGVGREIAHSQEKGNCLACHQMPTDPLAVSMATLGPRLEGMSVRYPSRAALRERISDASRFNASTIMPPYGRHQILTEAEIDEVSRYIHGL
ncbi:MAG: sulfur oxidation c-type cytochrome SoxX [Betaproteobacteria bacterium]